MGIVLSERYRARPRNTQHYLLIKAMQLLMGDIGVRYYFFDGDKIMGVGVDREIYANSP